MYKQNIAATGISDPCDLPNNLVLHYKSINMHGLKRMDSHSQVRRILASIPGVQLKLSHWHGHERI